MKQVAILNKVKSSTNQLEGIDVMSVPHVFFVFDFLDLNKHQIYFSGKVLIRTKGCLTGKSFSRNNHFSLTYLYVILDYFFIRSS